MTEMTTPHSNRTAALASGLSALALVVAAGAAFSVLAHVPSQAKRPSSRSGYQTAALPAAQPDSSARGGGAGEVSSQDRWIITGRVWDSAGALVPGALVRVKDKNTGRELLTTKTDQEGGFEIELSSTEEIEVRFEHPGFRAAIYSGDLLKSGSLNVILRMGRISEVVTITSSGRSAQAGSATRKPIRIHGGVVPPKLLHMVHPVYPAEARQQSVEGTIEIEALIDTYGGVKDARVLKGHPLLDAAALEAVRQWRYTPALMDGEPWPVEMGITLVFELKQ
jgi:TonB family protein